MDPINIIIAINIVLIFGANFSGAKAGFKSTITQVKDKPQSYLQTLPLLVTTLSLIALILAVFQIGTLNYSNEQQNIRLTALVIYLVFSWLQVWAYKSLGKNYSQDIVVFNKHSIVNNGPYKLIRHPHYISQIIIDLSAAAATLSFVVLPLAIIEIPLLILRASLEEKILLKHFKDEYGKYKKRTGFMIPFIG